MSPQQSTLHLNFNYTYFREPFIQGESEPQKLAMQVWPVTHILKNLYFNFLLSAHDFELL